MKILLVFVFAHLLLSAKGQITINGRIENYDGSSKVYYSPTVDGILFGLIQVTPTHSGNFKIKYQNKGLSTTRIYFGKLTFYFVHEENAQIDFAIDQSKIQFPGNTQNAKKDHVRDSVKQAALISIGGDYSEVNQFNNATQRSSTQVFKVEGCDYSLLVQKAATTDRAVFVIDSLTERELDLIQRLKIDGNRDAGAKEIISSEAEAFLINQVHSFYASVFLNGMMLKRQQQAIKLSQEPGSDSLIYNEQWERLIEKFFLNASGKIKPSTSTFEYEELVLGMAYTLSDYRKYDFEPPLTTDDELVTERLLMPNLSILDSLGLIDEDAVLYYKLHNLSRFLNTQTFYTPALLNAIDQLSLQYPNSQHISFYKPQIESLRGHLKAAVKPYDEAIVMKANFTTLDHLLEQFKGKNILLDIWATWCGPCIEDFGFKGVFNKYIDQGELVILYISIDKISWEKRWKENIKFNQLKGYHVLGNDLLITDVWSSLGGIAGRIPRYALVDKEGHIVVRDAARPSNQVMLIKQIEDVLRGK